MFSLGRIASKDERDNQFLLRELVAPIKAEREQFPRLFWYDGTSYLDQGLLPQCVEYAWHHWLAASPSQPLKAGHGPFRIAQKPPFWDYGTVYHEAQKIDEWPGEDYEGTSVRAGAKVLQSLGFIGSYSWAWDVDTLIDAVRYMGPVVVGTNWYSDMFYPNSRGAVKVGGEIAGGHAYLISGYSTKTRLFRGKNSWGKEWGKNGRFFIPHEGMAQLIAEDGEVCIASKKVV